MSEFSRWWLTNFCPIEQNSRGVAMAQEAALSESGPTPSALGHADVAMTADTAKWTKKATPGGGNQVTFHPRQTMQSGASERWLEL
jgi:hypothetical protein